MASYEFPKSFVWGTATASYQVEGAAAEDGRGPSVWDTFSHSPGHTAFEHTGDRSVDQYHRYKEDVALMKWLGAKAYRFSCSWSRVLPEGAGRVNEVVKRFFYGINFGFDSLHVVFNRIESFIHELTDIA